MEGTSKQSDKPPGSETTPYEQEFETTVEKEFECSGTHFERIKSHIRMPLGAMHWGRVPFNFELERIQVTDEKHKDLLLNVFCNSGASDPHWRCTFTVSVMCTLQQHEPRKSDEQSMTATRNVNSMVIPIMRMPPSAEGVSSATLNIKIKMNSWAGNYPSNVHSFSNKTNLTDATLIVEGQLLYVSRTILALHSTFFYTLFFDEKFPDAAKDEFPLKDVSYDDMVLFLTLIYPNIANDKHKCVNSVDAIENMLAMAERFGCDAVTKLMEKYLMGEMTEVEIEGFTLPRRLLISDRFRLSSPCSFLMANLRNDETLNRLGQSDEYMQLSESLRCSILDMRMRRPSELQSPESPDSVFMGSDEDEMFLGGPFRMRARRTGIQRSMPYYAGSGVALSQAQSANVFFGDVDRLAAVMGNFAVTSQMADRLQRAVQFLQSLSGYDFDQMPSFRRQLIHSHIINLVEAQNSNSIRAPIATLLTHVEILRGTHAADHGNSSRKRMRLRDFVLRP